jgi:hypothetical protein
MRKKTLKTKKRTRHAQKRALKLIAVFPKNREWEDYGKIEAINAMAIKSECRRGGVLPSRPVLGSDFRKAACSRCRSNLHLKSYKAVSQHILTEGRVLPVPPVTTASIYRRLMVPKAF